MKKPYVAGTVAVMTKGPDGLPANAVGLVQREAGGPLHVAIKFELEGEPLTFAMLPDDALTLALDLLGAIQHARDGDDSSVH